MFARDVIIEKNLVGYPGIVPVMWGIETRVPRPRPREYIYQPYLNNSFRCARGFFRKFAWCLFFLFHPETGNVERVFCTHRITRGVTCTRSPSGITSTARLSRTNDSTPPDPLISVPESRQCPSVCLIRERAVRFRRTLVYGP